jgi:L,D-transpeptidase catalytic domain/LysM domain
VSAVRRRDVVVATAVLSVTVALGACSASSEADTTTSTTVAATTAVTVESTPPTTDPPTTESSTSTSTTTTTTVADTTTTTAPPPPTDPTTTTVAAPAAGTPNPACIYTVAPGDSLNKIVAARNDPAVDVGAIAAENGIQDVNVINVGSLLDVCPGNGVDDVSGQPRVPPATDAAPPSTAPTPPPTTPDTVPAGTPLPTGVKAQQVKLNQLFGNLGLAPLTADGKSGRLTRQQLCAARVALNLPISRDDMAPGSPEEVALMSTNALPTPSTAPVQAGRWVLIDQTCQVLFVGAGPNNVTFVFQTSTGVPEHATRDQSASRVFRYDPAADNGGWHDSSQYPAAADNPLNGNMYKPIYFDAGQAIHGANTVPTSPASHGCARLHVKDQDTLVSWLGFGDATAPIWSKAKLALTVTVQGNY